MSGILEGLASGAASAGVQQLGNYLTSEKEQKQYKENVRMNFNLAQEAQRNAAVNQKEGLKNAGLSIASIGGANVAGDAGNSAPLQSKQSSAPNIQIAQDIAALQNSQSQTELNEEIKKGQEIKNDQEEVALNRMQAEDSVAHQTISDAATWYSEHGTEEEKTYWSGIVKWIEDNPYLEMNVGSYNGIVRDMDLYKMWSSVQREDMVNRQYMLVLKMQDTNDAASYLAKMPELEAKKLLSDMDLQFLLGVKASADANAANASANAANASADLMRSKIGEVEANIGYTRQLSKKAYHDDFLALKENGDWSSMLLQTLNEGSKAFMSGLGFGAGSAVVGAATKGKSVPSSVRSASSVGDARKASTAVGEQLKKGYTSNGRKPPKYGVDAKGRRVYFPQNDNPQ